MIDQFTHTDDTALVGVLLAVSSAFIGVTGLFLARFSARALIWVGIGLTMVSLALMTAASALQSLPLFLLWCIVGGIAYALTFTGGLALINRLAPERHRGATLSFLYLIAYALQAATAIGVGAVATAISLRIAVGAAAIALTVLCVAVAALLIVGGRAGDRPRMLRTR